MVMLWQPWVFIIFGRPSHVEHILGCRSAACSQLIRFKQSLELGKANFQVVTVEREKRTVAATCLSNGGNEKQRSRERGMMGVDC